MKVKAAVPIIFKVGDLTCFIKLPQSFLSIIGSVTEEFKTVIKEVLDPPFREY